MATKVLIVDDHPAVREGLAIRVASQPDMEVCGQAADTAEAVKLLEAVRPDVVVVDIQLETGNGLDLVERIRARDESIGILVWSMYPDKIYAQRALQAGALGYINKRHATDRMVEAIRRVRDGKIFLCEDTASQLLGSAVGRGKHLQASGVESLSDRELEVFRLIGEGLTTSQIARPSPSQRQHRGIAPQEHQRETGLENCWRTEPRRGAMDAGERLRAGAEMSVAFRSAKERGFRGAKGDHAIVIDSPVLTRLSAFHDLHGNPHGLPWPDWTGP